MIDVRDLMVGCYFQVAVDDLLNNEVGQIVSYDRTTKEIGILFDDGSVEHYLGSELISPLPITPEWLIKLGFTRSHQDGEFDHKDNENVIILCEDNGYTFDYECGGIEWCQCGVEYVHQLQNFYYLTTGQELTIGGEV